MFPLVLYWHDSCCMVCILCVFCALCQLCLFPSLLKPKNLLILILISWATFLCLCNCYVCICLLFYLFGFHKLSQVVKPSSSTLAEDEFVLVVLSTFYQFLGIFSGDFSKLF